MNAADGSPGGWRGRRRDSNGSAPVLTRAVTSTTGVVLTAVPGRRRRLSDGVLVEASVLARVLGVRLLTVRATVVLAPADVTAASSTDRDPAAPAAARSSDVAPARRRARGHGLAEAVRRIDEGAELLAAARRQAV
jgi:hypothetical protein